MSSNGPLVSIGIPTYNRASCHLREVIERSLGQTYPNIEVIVSDNCSTDDTPALMESFSDPRLRYFRQKTNIGPNNNFNYCLEQARGEYFLLFHDDDMIDEDFVEACMSSLTPGQEVGVIITGVRLINEHGDVRAEHSNQADAPTAAGFIFGWYAGKTTLFLCNTLYNTGHLKEIGGFHSKKHLFDDLVATFTLAAQYGRVDVEPVKASFRRHSNNRGSSVAIEDWIEDSKYLLELMCSLMPKDCRSLKDGGRKYFSRKMYRHVARNMESLARLGAYLQIYKSFGFKYSPVQFVFARKLKKLKRMLARG